MRTATIDDVSDNMRRATEALARPRPLRPVARSTTTPTDYEGVRVLGVLAIIGLIACVYAASVERPDAELHPGLVFDTSGMVRVDGSRPSDSRLLLVAVRKSRSRAELASGRVSMDAARRNAIRAAIACIGPGRRHDVSIDTGSLTGASAGLMFALSIVDSLEPLEVDGEIAGTGTITADGVVGPIGDLDVKVQAARNAGATVFLVPKVQAAEAQRSARALRVVGVGTLDEAIRSLGSTSGCPSEASIRAVRNG